MEYTSNPDIVKIIEYVSEEIFGYGKNFCDDLEIKYISEDGIEVPSWHILKKDFYIGNEELSALIQFSSKHGYNLAIYDKGLIFTDVRYLEDI